MLTFQLDAHSRASHGILECQECGSSFFINDPPKHHPRCKRSQGMVYHYTLKEVQKWEKEYTEKGFLACGELGTYLLGDAFKHGHRTKEDALGITKAYVDNNHIEYWDTLLENFIDMFGPIN